MGFLDVTVNSAGFFLMDWIQWLLGQILNGIFMFLSNFNMTYLAVCIIVFTILIRSLMIPLTIKQQKFSKMSSVIQPEIKAIQDKYKNKKDQESVTKMNREVTGVYEKYGTSPTGGCLTSLITLPIMWALYRIIYDLPSYIPTIGDIYDKIANSMADSGIDGYAESVAKYVKDLDDSRIKFSADGGVNGLIDALKNFKTNNWKEVAQIFKDNSDCYNTIIDNSEKIIHYNKFIGGLNIKDYPTDKKWPGLIIPILAVATQWYSMKQIQAKNSDSSANDNPTMQSMQMMTKIMPFFSGFICLALPIGVGIYWITGSVFTIVQQFFVQKHMDKIDMNELIKINIEKAKSKNAAKKQSGLWNKILEAGADPDAQNGSSLSIKDYARMSAKKNDDVVSNGSTNTSSSNTGGKKSISDYANIMNSKKN